MTQGTKFPWRWWARRGGPRWRGEENDVGWWEQKQIPHQCYKPGPSQGSAVSKDGLYSSGQNETSTKHRMGWLIHCKILFHTVHWNSSQLHLLWDQRTINELWLLVLSTLEKHLVYRMEWFRELAWMVISVSWKDETWTSVNSKGCEHDSDFMADSDPMQWSFIQAIIIMGVRSQTQTEIGTGREGCVWGQWGAPVTQASQRAWGLLKDAQSQIILEPSEDWAESLHSLGLMAWPSICNPWQMSHWGKADPLMPLESTEMGR